MAGAIVTPAQRPWEVESMGSPELKTPKASWPEQWHNVLQLSKDRKNKFGGITQSIKEFDEMGPQGEHWPLAGESIKREFGVKPKWAGEDEDVEYVEHIEAASHRMLERAVKRLESVCFDLAKQYRNVFDPDLAGDRDYDWLKKKAAEAERVIEETDRLKDAALNAAEELRDKDRLSVRRRVEYEKQLDHYRHMVRKARAMAPFPTQLSQVNAALVQLTYDLWGEDLIVQSARLRSLREEKEMEDRNMNVYLLYRKITDPPPDGYGSTAKSAYEAIESEYGVLRDRAKQIVGLKHQEVTGEVRKPGRPKKKGA